MKKIIAIFTILFILMISSAFANTATEAIQEKVNQILDILKEPNYATPGEYPKMRKQVEDVVLTIFDFKEMSSRTVGSTWKNTSETEQNQITEAFKDLLRASYLDQLTAFNGVEVKFEGERKDSTGKAEVQTKILAEGKAYQVNYRLMPKENSWLVYDVIIENVGLIKNYRDQFQDVLAKGSTKLLIEKLETKVKELRAAEAKKG